MDRSAPRTPSAAVERLRPLRRLLTAGGDVLVYVLSGAGLSATAGLRTYRGPQGLYTTGELPPLHAANAVPSRVHLVWEHLHGIVESAADAATRPPSPAYRALAEFQSRLAGRATAGATERATAGAAAGVSVAASAGQRLVVGTQNIDGLHQHAGVDGVLELHGSVQRAVCLNGRCRAVAPTLELDRDEAAVPLCAACSTRTRPDVVLFGERPYLMDEAMKVAAAADVVLVVGTSLQVWPAAGTVAQALEDDVPGLWLDTEPGRAWRELPDEARGCFRALIPVCGDLNKTLPAVLDALDS